MADKFYNRYSANYMGGDSLAAHAQETTQEQQQETPARTTPQSPAEAYSPSGLEERVSKLVNAIANGGLSPKQEQEAEALARQTQHMDPNTRYTFNNYFGDRIQEVQAPATPVQTAPEKQAEPTVAPTVEPTQPATQAQPTQETAAQPTVATQEVSAPQPAAPVQEAPQVEPEVVKEDPLAKYRENPKSVTPTVVREAMFAAEPETLGELYKLNKDAFNDPSIMLDAAQNQYPALAQDIARRNPDFVTPQRLNQMAGPSSSPEMAGDLAKEFQMETPELTAKIEASLQKRQEWQQKQAEREAAQSITPAEPSMESPTQEDFMNMDPKEIEALSTASAAEYVQTPTLEQERQRQQEQEQTQERGGAEMSM